MRRIVFATFNRGKRVEAAGLLEGCGIELVDPRDVGIDSLPQETGETFLDNALLKAAHAFTVSGLPAMADDSGLEVRALGGAPGVRSARYGGAEHDDAANIRRLLDEVRDQEDRSARFVCTLVLLVPGREANGMAPSAGVEKIEVHPLLPARCLAFSATGEAKGRIIDEPLGDNGFGYDPVFFRDDIGMTFAQIPRDLKNELSHRGAAFRKMRAMLAGIRGDGRN